MDWIFVGGLGIVWSVLLVPSHRRRRSPRLSVEEFERNMGLLAETEKATGRWIVAPRKGERFLGRRERARCRARERRRRVFVFLIEALGLSFLIGLFPPLHRMWIATAALAGLLAVYVWLLVHVKQQERARGREAAEEDPLAAVRTEPPEIDSGLESPFLDVGDRVHVTVRSAAELEAVNA